MKRYVYGASTREPNLYVVCEAGQDPWKDGVYLYNFELDVLIGISKHEGNGHTFEPRDGTAPLYRSFVYLDQEMRRGKF